MSLVRVSCIEFHMHAAFKFISTQWDFGQNLRLAPLTALKGLKRRGTKQSDRSTKQAMKKLKAFCCKRRRETAGYN